MEGRSGELPPMLTEEQVRIAKSDAQAFLGDETNIQFICGESVGNGFYIDDLENPFENDRMTDGVTIFAKDSGGQPMIAFRDSLKEMIVPSKTGATIRKVNDDADGGVWIVEYQTGIVETFNVSSNKSGQIFNIWTTIKPKGILQGRGSLFVSRCEKI